MKPSILRNLMFSFLALGLVMGAVFPVFANLFVEWKPGMLVWFVVSALAAGAIVGLANYWLVNWVLLSKLRRISQSCHGHQQQGHQPYLQHAKP